MTTWTREALDWRHIKQFDKVIRKGDLIECLSNDMSVQDSLEFAAFRGGGEAWAVLDAGNQVIGVYGWTLAGAVWSYWKDLNPQETRELMSLTGSYVWEMVKNATQQGLSFLANYVWEDNLPAVVWLRASHCFSLDLDHRYDIGNKRFIAFKTKPLEELSRYV